MTASTTTRASTRLNAATCQNDLRADRRNDRVFKMDEGGGDETAADFGFGAQTLGCSTVLRAPVGCPFCVIVYA